MIYQSTALVAPGIVRPQVETPAVGVLALHWFPQLTRIMSASTPWHGGDMKAFIAEIPGVIQAKRETGELDPKSVILVVDWNEHANTVLDGSMTCYLWMKYGVQAVHESTQLPVGCFRPYLHNQEEHGVWPHHHIFDFLCPDIYPNCKVREQPGPTGEGSYRWYDHFAHSRLRLCAHAGQPLLTFCTGTYFQDGSDVEPWVLDLQLGMAQDYAGDAIHGEGGAVIYSEASTQAQADRAAQLAAQAIPS